LQDLEKADFISNLPKRGTANAQQEKGNSEDLYCAGLFKLLACVGLGKF